MAKQADIREIASAITGYTGRKLEGDDYAVIGKMINKFGVDRLKSMVEVLGKLSNHKKPVHYLYTILSGEDKTKKAKADIKELAKGIGEF